METIDANVIENAAGASVTDRRLPWLRLAIMVALSLPTAVWALWEHDTENLARLGVCSIWLAFGYWWGWKDATTTLRGTATGASGSRVSSRTRPGSSSVGLSAPARPSSKETP